MPSRTSETSPSPGEPFSAPFERVGRPGGGPGSAERRLRRAGQNRRAPGPPPVADVTAVLVAHDGEHWLPDALAALAGQTVQPRRMLAVDTGSSDGTAALLAAATGHSVDRVVRLRRGTGFGAAVAAALQVETDAYGGPAAWLWLLHDDCAPEPTALAELLEEADESPSAALLGPKVRDWDDPRRLVEVGLTTDTAGHRSTGLERREYDQGQHDVVRDVLAVGTAGALLRRDVWDDLGGLDPELPVFRDDLDLGWRVNAAGHRVLVVPRARVRHARAATTGRRQLDAVRGAPEAVDRRHMLLVLLAHAPAARLPFTVLRLLLATGWCGCWASCSPATPRRRPTSWPPQAGCCCPRPGSRGPVGPGRAAAGCRPGRSGRCSRTAGSHPVPARGPRGAVAGQRGRSGPAGRARRPRARGVRGVRARRRRDPAPAPAAAAGRAARARPGPRGPGRRAAPAAAG